ncbi:olfactory receptor 51G2-like [Lissotriton helveticus]
MSTVNSSNIDHLWLLLMGFPGADDLNNTNIWMSLPLCSLYLLSISGNCLILLLIKLDKQLRDPMYLLLSMLATTDLCLTFATLPTTMSVFLFDARRIHFFACLTQLFFIHMLCAMESSILVAMAFDRYVAICKPLQYASILHPIISKIGLVALLRCFCLHFAVPFLLRILPFCDKQVLSFAFCYHTDVMKLACADTTITSTYNLVVVITTYPVDAIFILLSYIMILKNIQNRAQQGEGLKALNTCVSHLCVVMLFYIPLISLSLASRYGQKDSILLRVLLGGILLVVPPALNPMIYSIKTKQIRNALRKRFWVAKLGN